MAHVLDDAEFWLPTEFLPDNLFMEDSLKTAASRPVSLNLSSVLSSPVESTVSSSEKESSDEEFLDALTQRLAQSSLHETKIPITPYFNLSRYKNNNWYVSSSPPSTLTLSANGSPNGTLQCPSPPETPFRTEKEPSDLVYAAAEHVARLKTGFNSTQHVTNTTAQTRSHLSCRCLSHLSYSYRNLFQNHPHSAQFQFGRYDKGSKEECSLECRKMGFFSVLLDQDQGFQTKRNTTAYQTGRCKPLQGLVHHPWQTQNQSEQLKLNSCVLRTAINSRSSAKRQSIGTGVFLPRSYANPPEHRKHTGFPSARPVKDHAFNLSFEDMHEGSQRPFNDSPGPYYGNEIL